MCVFILCAYVMVEKLGDYYRNAPLYVLASYRIADNRNNKALKH